MLRRNCSLYLISVLICCCSSLHDVPDLYSEDNPDSDHQFYPFQQYIQVRKSYSHQHLPIYMGEEGPHSNPSGQMVQAAASDQVGAHNDGSSGNYHYSKPRLTEELETWGKQEVYEEKGYIDSDYDHHNHIPHNSGTHNDVQSTNTRPQYKTLADSADGSSTDVLYHAATDLYDKDAHQHGIYKARDGIYCPPVTDFNLGSKSMKPGKNHLRPPGKPRLPRLGPKIDCLRRKYFGENPFPSTIFKDPEDSKLTPIQGGSMADLFKSFKRNIYN